MESHFLAGFADELVKIAISPESISLAGRSRRLVPSVLSTARSMLHVADEAAIARQAGKTELAKSLSGQVKELKRLEKKMLSRMTPDQKEYVRKNLFMVETEMESHFLAGFSDELVKIALDPRLAKAMQKRWLSAMAKKEKPWKV